jgi:hypothetical protein
MYLPPLRPFYRAAEAVVTLSREVWNRLCQTVEDHHKAIVANRVVAFRGGQISEGPSGTILSVNVPQIGEFQVAALPASVNISGSMIVPPYAVCRSYFNGSAGSYNVSIALTRVHSLNQIVYADQVSETYWGMARFQDGNGSLITMKEQGAYGLPCESTLLKDGGAAGDVANISTYTYTIKDPAGAVSLITLQSVPVGSSGTRSFPMTVGTPATKGLVIITNPLTSPKSETYQVISAFESTGDSACT